MFTRGANHRASGEMEGDARGEEVSGRGGGTRLRVNRKVRLVMIFYGWHAGGLRTCHESMDGIPMRASKRDPHSKPSAEGVWHPFVALSPSRRTMPCFTRRNNPVGRILLRGRKRVEVHSTPPAHKSMTFQGCSLCPALGQRKRRQASSSGSLPFHARFAMAAVCGSMNRKKDNIAATPSQLSDESHSFRAGKKTRGIQFFAETSSGSQNSLVVLVPHVLCDAV